MAWSVSSSQLWGKMFWRKLKTLQNIHLVIYLLNLPTWGWISPTVVVLFVVVHILLKIFSLSFPLALMILMIFCVKEALNAEQSCDDQISVALLILWSVRTVTECCYHRQDHGDDGGDDDDAVGDGGNSDDGGDGDVALLILSSVRTVNECCYHCQDHEDRGDDEWWMAEMTTQQGWICGRWYVPSQSIVIIIIIHTGFSGSMLSNNSLKDENRKKRKKKTSWNLAERSVFWWGDNTSFFTSFLVISRQNQRKKSTDKISRQNQRTNGGSAEDRQQRLPLFLTVPPWNFFPQLIFTLYYLLIKFWLLSLCIT